MDTVVKGIYAQSLQERLKFLNLFPFRGLVEFPAGGHIRKRRIGKDGHARRGDARGVNLIEHPRRSFAACFSRAPPPHA